LILSIGQFRGIRLPTGKNQKVKLFFLLDSQQNKFYCRQSSSIAQTDVLNDSVKTPYSGIEEETIADAILDRLVYTSHRIELRGERLRKNMYFCSNQNAKL